MLTSDARDCVMVVSAYTHGKRDGSLSPQTEANILFASPHVRKKTNKKTRVTVLLINMCTYRHNVSEGKIILVTGTNDWRLTLRCPTGTSHVHP